MNRLLKKYLPKLIDGTAKLTPQPKDVEPTYYPKRTPEDGTIDWNESTLQIYNLIRAVTHPFPGAFSFLDGKDIYIWKAQPFDTKLRYDDNENGEIIEVFYNNWFVVKTSDSSILITDYEGRTMTRDDKGKVFESRKMFLRR